MHKIKCSKCEGTGKLSHYSHIANGNCFQCEGKGYKLLSDKEFNSYQDEQEIIDQQYREALEEELAYEEELKQQRKQEEERKQQSLQKYQQKLSYIGNIGDKVNLKLEYVKRNSTRYGESYLLRDENKNSIVFYSKEIYTVMDELFHITGTIKEHKEYSGFKQTVLKNVKVLNNVDIGELSDEEIAQLDL
jgi:hypothetical protein